MCILIYKFVGLFWREGVFGCICFREESLKFIFSKFIRGEGGGFGFDLYFLELCMYIYILY